MAVMVCPNCGAHFRVNDARWEFENRVDGASYDDPMFLVRLCADCAVQEWDRSIARQYVDAGMEVPEDRWDDGSDYVSDACLACGNPAYPHCMDGCPMYDD